MPRLLIIVILALVNVSSFAQDAEPVAAPGAVALTFSTEGNRDTFHLGELIPVSYAYTAETAGQYIYVSQPDKLVAGRGLEVTCTPSVDSVRSLRADDSIARFEQMLIPSCAGAGAGGGIGGSCFDCDWERLLNRTPLSFGPVRLNSLVRFRTPGVYKCKASSAEITTAPREDKIRAALLVKSNDLELTIVDDPKWASAAASAYEASYNERCRGEDVAQNRFLECSDLAARISYLDTLESLRAEVRFYDGKNHGWDNGFWDAIASTSHPSDALHLMTNRIQDPDVQVSSSDLESLAMWALKAESPDAFQSDSPTLYHSQARDQMRKYVRLLGSSLAAKDSDVLQESMRTYRQLAEQDYCDGPLIPVEERHAVLSAVQVSSKLAK